MEILKLKTKISETIQSEHREKDFKKWTEAQGLWDNSKGLTFVAWVPGEESVLLEKYLKK